MRDGYYLSTYIHIDSLANIIGIVKRHDQNISLWHKSGNCVKLIHYWELERITGSKQHGRPFYDIVHAKDVLNKLLGKSGLTLNDMVEIWGTPNLQTCNDYHSAEDLPKYSYHSIAHLFSAIMLDTTIFNKETIIGLAVDCGPDGIIDTKHNPKFFFTGCVVQNGKIEIFPIISPGPLWNSASQIFKLREGTLMALGSASKSIAFNQLEDIPLLKDMFCMNQADDLVGKLKEKIFGFKESDQEKLFNLFDPLFTEEENKISMVIKVIQAISFKIMGKNIDDILDKYGIESSKAFLAMAGGYVLNCPTNSYLMKKYRFKGFIAPPCVNDCGLSLGMALYAFYKKLGNFEFKLENAFYGDVDTSLISIISNSVYSQYIKSVSDMDINKVVDDIMVSPIIWFNGASEIGPRALGNRSILADPRSLEVKDKLNHIKKREWWRPVAPIILDTDVDYWFEDSFETPYMLHTFNVKPAKFDIIPAVVHLDGTARIQTINRESNPLLYEVICSFKKATGIPIICNTSLNDKGEAIINRIEEAFNFSLRKGINIMYINGKRIELHNHSLYRVESPLTRPAVFPVLDIRDKKMILNQFNPHNIPDNVLKIYYLKNLEQNFDITNERIAKGLIIYANNFRGKQSLYNPYNG